MKTVLADSYRTDLVLCSSGGDSYGHGIIQNVTTRWRTILVDGETLLRNVLAKAICLDNRFELVAEAEDGFQARELCLRHQPDLVVSDVDLPKLNGIELARSIIRQSPNTRMLALSHLKDPITLNGLYEAGVHGYVSKDESLEIFEEGMVEVASGRSYYPALFCESLKQLQENPHAFSKILTLREQEILCYVASGLTSRSIGDRLNLGTRTIETYRYRMMKKIGVENVAGLIDYALKNGFVKR